MRELSSYAVHLKSGKYVTRLACSFDEIKQAFEAPITYIEEPEFRNTVFTFSAVQNSYYKLSITPEKREREAIKLLINELRL